MKFVPEKSDKKTKDEATNKVNWGPVSAVLTTVGVFFLSQVVASILLILIAVSVGGESIDSLQSEDTTLGMTGYQFLANVLMASSLFGLVVVFLRHKKSSFKAIGLRGKPQLSDFGKALIGYGLYFLGLILASIVLNAISPEAMNQEQDIGFNRDASGLQLLPIFVSLVILPPIVEEILCRGVLFSGLRSKLSFWVSTAITSVIFAAAHLQWGNDAPLLWAAAVDTLMLSVVLCWLRENTGRLWAPISLHAIKNGLAFATIFLFQIS